MKYSVIIPVYNAEKTLSRCLDSLVAQIPNNAEIILVNDGSTDGSEEIALRYAENHRNIVYHRHENSGVSYTRNVGLSLASGEYILFVDSDDYVEDMYFSRLDFHLGNYETDMLLFASKTNMSSSGVKTGEFQILIEENIAAQAGDLLRRQLLYALWDKVFKRSIIEKYKIRFPTQLKIGEDMVFVISYLVHIQRFSSTNDCLYVLDVSDMSSLSRSRREYVFDHLQQANILMLDAIQTSAWSEHAKRTLRKSVVYISCRSVYSACKELLKYETMTNKQRRQRIRDICNQYNGKNIKPEDWKCGLLALPVQFRMAWTIDMMSKIADWRRKRR